MKKIRKKIRKFYNWDIFMTQCRYYTKKLKKPPYKMIFMGPDAEKISKEVDDGV